MEQSVEALQAEIERLQHQLARKSKTPPVEYLGELIPAEVIAELATSRKLSAVGVRNKREGMHGDGGNLWLQVTSGGRSWIFRYRFGAKQREMGLGSLGEVSLAEARGRAIICRRLVRQGVDPIDRRRTLDGEAALAQAKMVTFKQAAERYIKAHAASWKNDKHAAQWPSTLVAYVYPTMGDLAVQGVDTGLVLKVLEQEITGPDGKPQGTLWQTRPETASRVRGRIESVLDWASARGLRRGENPARWRGHIEKLLPPRSRVKAVKHHAALPWGDLGAFWADLAAHQGSAAEALRFAILTAARTGEVVGATWDEIDLDAKVWTIPAGRMKAQKEHRVPLSTSAVEILERMKPLASAKQRYLFPGGKVGRPLSNMAMLMLIKKTMAREGLTAHGFRSAFRDWAAESTAYPGDLVEMALAHAIGNKVEAAYRRGDQFEKRRRLMEDWARHAVTEPAPKADNVRQIGEAR